MDFFDPFELQFSSPSSDKNLVGNKRYRHESTTTPEFSDYSVTDEDDNESLLDDVNEFSSDQPLKKRIRIHNRMYGENIFLNIRFPNISDDHLLPPPLFKLESPNLRYRIDFRRKEAFLIGTSEECEVRIPINRIGESKVSPHHAKLIYNPISGIVSVVPLSRKRVVWINNISYLQEYEISHNKDDPSGKECFRRVSIHHGDVLTIGRRSFDFTFLEDVERFLEPDNVSNFPNFGNQNDNINNMNERRRGRLQRMSDDDNDEGDMLEFLRLEEERHRMGTHNEQNEWNRAFDRVEDMKREEKEVVTGLDFLIDIMSDEEEDEDDKRKRKGQQQYINDEEEEEEELEVNFFSGSQNYSSYPGGNNNNNGNNAPGVNIVMPRGGKKRKRSDDDHAYKDNDRDNYRF